jgi:hypothetical protein
MAIGQRRAHPLRPTDNQPTRGGAPLDEIASCHPVFIHCAVSLADSLPLASAILALRLTEGSISSQITKPVFVLFMTAPLLENYFPVVFLLDRVYSQVKEV